MEHQTAFALLLDQIEATGPMVALADYAQLVQMRPALLEALAGALNVTPPMLAAWATAGQLRTRHLVPPLRTMLAVLDAAQGGMP